MSDGSVESDTGSYEEIDGPWCGGPGLLRYNTLIHNKGPSRPIQVPPPIRPANGFTRSKGRSSSLPRSIQHQLLASDNMWKGHDARAPSLSPPNPGRSIDNRPPLPPPNPAPPKFIKQHSFPGGRHTSPPSHTTGSAPSPPLKPKRQAPTPPKAKRSPTFCAPSTTDPVAEAAVASGKHGPPVAPKRVKRSISLGEIEKPKSMRDFVVISDELSLPELVKRYKDDFPVRVKVSKGFYGDCNKTSISEGDMFNVHFLKNTKVVVLDDGYNTKFKVALNSAIEFGVLYNPHKNKEAAKVGLTFERVSDVMAMKTLPRVMTSLKPHKGSSPESSVEANELLIVRTVKSKLKGRVLKVYSPRLKMKKELPEGCCGKFSTKPYDVRLFLPEIAEHLADSFPLQAMLFVSGDTAGEIPSSIISDAVNLRRFDVEASLIATVFFFSEDQYDDTAAKLVEVPFDLDIAVQVLEEESDTEELYDETKNLFERFDPTSPTSLHAYVNVPSSDTSAQAALYASVRMEDKLAGVNLEAPAALYVNDSGSPSHHPLDSASLSSSSPLSEASSRKVRFTAQHYSDDLYDDTSTSALGELQKKMDQLRKKVENLNGGGISLSVVQKVESKMESLSREVHTVKSVMEGKVSRLQTNLAAMLEKMQALEKGRSNIVLTPPPLVACDSKTVESNKQYLATLDYMQMVKLLELLGMKQYYTSFMAERVTGEILLECDEQVLETELKMTSKLHRVRLMKIISGKHSAENILRGEDPYVYTTKSI